MFSDTTMKLPRLPGFVGFTKPPFAVNDDQVKEFEEKFNQSRFTKGLVLNKMNAKLLDLSDPKQMEEYLELRQTIFNGNQLGTHLPIAADRQFVPEKGTWLVYLEWAEISMETIEHQSAGEA